MKCPVVILTFHPLREWALTPFFGSRGGWFWLCFSLKVTMPRDR
jgi:hypothetical protein